MLTHAEKRKLTELTIQYADYHSTDISLLDTEDRNEIAEQFLQTHQINEPHIRNYDNDIRILAHAHMSQIIESASKSSV